MNTRTLLLVAPLAATAMAGESLPVRVRDGGHYLEWHGRPILPIGDSITQGWMEQGTDLDQRAYLDALAARGMNVVLLWSYIATSAAAQRADPRVGYDSPEVWPWQGSPDDRSLDLTRFNETYFTRLHEFAKYAAKHPDRIVSAEFAASKAGGDG